MVNLKGKKFGKWKVISSTRKKGRTEIFWVCQCECGTKKSVSGTSLKKGCSKSCGCLRKKDLTGMKFGRWKVISLSNHKKQNGHNKYWDCICECGIKKPIAAYSLLCGNSKSCGCLLKEISSLPPGVASMHAVHRNYTRTAKKRNLSFSLTMKEFEKITSSNCYYCGRQPNQKSKITKKNRRNGHYLYNGIDRVDNSKGYIVENCVSCCKRCNHAKSDQTQKEFLEWIKNAYDCCLSNQGHNFLRRQIKTQSINAPEQASMTK